MYGLNESERKRVLFAKKKELGKKLFFLVLVHIVDLRECSVTRRYLNW